MTLIKGTRAVADLSKRVGFTEALIRGGKKYEKKTGGNEFLQKVTCCGHAGQPFPDHADTRSALTPGAAAQL